MKFIKSYSPTKKVYHYFIEYGNKGDFLFIFTDSISLNQSRNLVHLLKEKFSKIKLNCKYAINQRNRDLNSIFREDITRDKLHDYDCVFLFPDIYDEEQANKELFGIPGFKAEKSSKLEDNILEQYDVDQFAVINVSKEITNRNYESLVDYLKLERKIDSVLIGDGISCTDIINNCNFNPIFIYNNNFLVSYFLENCRFIISENFIENYQNKTINISDLEIEDIKKIIEIRL